MATSDENTEKLEKKLDKIADDVSDIKVTLGAQHEVLRDHIRRTEILEEAIKPLTAQSNGMKGIMKALVVLGIVAAIAEAIHIVMH